MCFMRDGDCLVNMSPQKLSEPKAHFMGRPKEYSNVTTCIKVMRPCPMQYW